MGTWIGYSASFGHGPGAASPQASERASVGRGEGGGGGRSSFFIYT